MAQMVCPPYQMGTHNPISIYISASKVDEPAWNYSSIVYLGMPIGSSMVFARSLKINHFGEKARKAHGFLSQKKTGRFHPGYTMLLVIPHFLAMSWYWNIFSVSDKRQLRSDHYKYTNSAQLKTMDKECVSFASVRCCRSHYRSH